MKNKKVMDDREKDVLNSWKKMLSNSIYGTNTTNNPMEYDENKAHQITEDAKEILNKIEEIFKDYDRKNILII